MPLTSISDPQHRQALQVLIGGICALALAMGIGRFAFTPVLPLMHPILPGWDRSGGLLAAVNLAGYLIGALAFSSGLSQRWRHQLLLACLVAVPLTTAAMGLSSNWYGWLFLRFVVGLASAGAFILVSTQVLEALARAGKPRWSGLFYGGVGIGIVLSGILTPPLSWLGGWQAAWLGLGACGGLLLFCSLGGLRHGGLRPATQAMARESKQARFGGLLPWLAGAYFLEGLGYIVTGTFLVAHLAQQSPSPALGSSAWILLGLAAIPSCLLWADLGQRFGLLPMLAAAHLVQAAGIALPVLIPSLSGALLGALLYGATSMGIVTLALGLGRSLTPNSAQRTLALLTAAFGVGQVLGPALAGKLAEASGSFDLPLVLAAAVVAVGALVLWLGQALNRPQKPRPQP